MLRLKPSYKKSELGGNRLAQEYGKNIEGSILESWELSIDQDNPTMIDNGFWKDKTFRSYIEKLGKYAIGDAFHSHEMFPILLKLVDTNDKLPIQVHPDDFYAKMHENTMGNSKFIYILEADQNSYIYFGVKKYMLRSDFKKHLDCGNVEEVLNKISVQKGDYFYIPAGVVYGIGENIVFCEVQKNTNCTYPIYNFNDKQEIKKDYEVDLNKAFDAIKLTPTQPIAFEKSITEEVWGNYQFLMESPYFHVEKYMVKNIADIQVEQQSFCAILILDGEATFLIGEETLIGKKGDTLFIPAQKNVLKVSGSCDFLTVKIV